MADIPTDKTAAVTQAPLECSLMYCPHHSDHTTVCWHKRAISRSRIILNQAILTAVIWLAFHY
jgi:hypothetical protein